MTAKLLGGMKKKSFSPKPMDTKREKRKESEPCIDVGDSIEEDNAETHPDIDPPDNTQWMEDTMKKMKERTHDVSELERNMSRVQWNMTEVERKLDKVTNSLTLINEGSEARDKNLDELLACFSVGLEKRKKKTEEKIENMGTSLSEKMNEKFSDFEKRISSIERGAGSAGHFGFGASQGGWGSTPTSLKAVIHGFKQDAKEKDVKTFVTKVISETGKKEEHIVNYPAIPITHVSWN